MLQACIECQAGYYCPFLDSAEALPCLSGSYSTGGQDVCIQCPAGFTCRCYCVRSCEIYREKRRESVSWTYTQPSDYLYEKKDDLSSGISMEVLRVSFRGRCDEDATYTFSPRVRSYLAPDNG